MKVISEIRIWVFLVSIYLLILTQNSLSAFTYVTAGERSSPDTVVHPIGYTGKGGVLEISVGLHPDYAYLAEDFEFSATQAVAIWNNLVPTTGNLTPSAEIPRKGGVDVMGVLIHELGHTLGLAHPNQGDGQFRNAAKSTAGRNRIPELVRGRDGIAGSGDDMRGDDVSLNYFKISDNNPFYLPDSGVIDQTTYSRDLERLPAGDSYAAIASPIVAAKCCDMDNTIAIMVGGGSQIPGLVRRSIGADDVAGLRYAMSGLDGKQGTKDDYTYHLTYVGVDADADVVIKFDKPDANASTGVATVPARVNGHRIMRPGRPIRYNPNLANNRTWYFPVLEPVEIEGIVPKEGSSLVPIRTVPWKRYAITLSGHKKGMHDLRVLFKGNELQRTGADYQFFMAESGQSELEILHSGDISLSRFLVFQVIGKPLQNND